MINTISGLTQIPGSLFRILSTTEHFLIMFPNFLRVTPLTVYILTVPFNETTTISVRSPTAGDMLKLNVLAEALGFNYEVVFAPDNHEVRLLPNGSWTGAYAMLQRRETDLVCCSANLHETSNNHFLLSYSYSMSDVTFVTKKPEHVPDPAVFLHPFSIQVWLSIIACILLIPPLFHFLLRKKHSASSLLWSTLGSIVGQGMGQIPERIREYLVLGTWIIGSGFLYYFYTAVLLSFLTFPSLSGVRTIEDLANGIKDRKYQTTMHPLACYDRAFSDINITSFQVIGKHLQENDLKRTAEFLQFLELSSDDKKPAFVGVRAEFLPCKERYFISEESFYFIAEVFAMHKEFCCASEVDKIIHRVWASGIFEKFRARIDFLYFRFDLQTYGKYWHSPPSDVQLSMTMLKGPFIFLIFSHSMAFLVFLIEVCIGNLKHLEDFKKRFFN